MFQPRSAERTLWSGHRYSPRRVAASIAATVALVGVFSIDYTAATAYAAVPAYAQALNNGVPLTVAHRGDPVAAPENTLPAIRAAVNGGADIVEFDLQLTRDGHAVLMHDDHVDRTTDGEGPVGRYTLDEIRALDAGSWFGDAWRGTRVPTAEEALGVVADAETTVLVEFKGTWGDDDITPVLELIDESGLAERTVVASFEARTMLALKRLAPELQRALTMRVLPASPLGLVTAYDATLVVTSMRSVELSPRIVAQLQRAGVTVIVYTLNSASYWQQARAAGVDAIVTDDPRALGHWATWLGERGW